MGCRASVLPDGLTRAARVMIILRSGLADTLSRFTFFWCTRQILLLSHIA